MRLMVCTGAPVDEPEALAGLDGWSIAASTPEHPPAPDDWFHAVIGPRATGTDIAALAALCASTGADLSCELRLPAGSVDESRRAELLDGFEQLVDAVGAQTGLFVTGVADLGELLGAGLSAEDAVELVTQWALQYGLALVICFLDGAGAAAVKPDGRVLSSERRGPHPQLWAGRNLAAMAMIDSYFQDPSDLEGCLAAGLSPLATTLRAVPGP